MLPTDTVYGVAARLDRPGAIARLYVAKGRPEERPIPVLIASPGELARLTRDLPEGAPAPALPAVEAPPAVERRIAHPATQSHILVGAPAMARDDPDFFPLFVGNYVLGGGGFVSRLTTEVREKRGLCYSVSAGYATESVEALLDAGYASGDGNPFDDEVTSFTFDPDFNVGLVMFEEYLAGLTAALNERTANGWYVARASK